jgi:hypothetical protein
MAVGGAGCGYEDRSFCDVHVAAGDPADDKRVRQTRRKHGSRLDLHGRTGLYCLSYRVAPRLLRLYVVRAKPQSNQDEKQWRAKISSQHAF